MVEPQAPADFSGRRIARATDIAAPGVAETIFAGKPDLVFHLAAIVSGEAEADFDKGYRINLDATRRCSTPSAPPTPPPAIALASCSPPRSRFSARRFPDRIGDEFFATPLTSYGTQKAIAELLLSDYSRRGFFDGIGLRLPTICVRPGRPNKAASGFFSNIIREPLVGQEAVLPVGDDVRHWHASPRSAVGFLRHAAEMDLSALGPRRNLTMPGALRP